MCPVGLFENLNNANVLGTKILNVGLPSEEMLQPHDPMVSSAQNPKQGLSPLAPMK